MSSVVQRPVIINVKEILDGKTERAKNWLKGVKDLIEKNKGEFEG